MVKRSKSIGRKAASKTSGKSSSEYKAVIDDLVAGNRILYDQDVVDGYVRPLRRHAGRLSHHPVLAAALEHPVKAQFVADGTCNPYM